MVAGAEERGAGSGKDLKEEKGDNTTMNNDNTIKGQRRILVVIS